MYIPQTIHFNIVVVGAVLALVAILTKKGVVFRTRSHTESGNPNTAKG